MSLSATNGQAALLHELGVLNLGEVRELFLSNLCELTAQSHRSAQ
jgi:hypothetical protein